MSKIQELGFFDVDIQELKAVRRDLGMNKYNQCNDGMPIAISKDEMNTILTECGKMLGFNYISTF